MTTAPSKPAPANWLTYDDEVFLRSATVLDAPVSGQIAWRFDGVVPVEAVQRVIDRLVAGPVNRLVVRPRVPGARSRFVRGSLTPPVRVDPRPIANDGIVRWLDATLETPLDPVKGPPLAVVMGYTADGRTVVTYNTSHIVSDGGLMLTALVAAVRDETLPRLPVDDLAAAQVTLWDEVKDAAAMAREVGRSLVQLGRHAVRPPARLPAQSSEQRPRRAPQPDDDVIQPLTFVAVDCPVADWQDAAAQAGATSNGLVVAITAEILLEAGIAEAGRPVKVALPVSTRRPGDLRSNATSGVSIAIDTQVRDGVGRVSDLGQIRERSKQAFTALADGTRVDPTAPMQPLTQALPDRVARLFAGGVATPLCLASNLGRLEPSFAAPFGTPAQAVLFRAVSVGATRGTLRRLRGGVTSWWNETGEVCTLGLRVLDPDAVPDAAALREIVRRVYRRWGLTPAFW